ncbi:MAG: hypothetical protein A2X81_14915 [Desulfobacterales bacterium GWB2_56_26]|nr:MAG: hypothetical protein A2X81_14915 [Desulfobacterales bacterium GWB2_56_26]
MNRKTILLVDDEEPILASIGWLLRANDFEVETASSGEEAIAILRERRFDLVVTDLVMPKADGITVLEEAKSLYPEIGVIILTGYGDIGSAVRTLQLGADDYLQKPCEIEDLVNKANRSFERQDLIARLKVQNEQLREEITARRIAEQKLEEARASLEQQVAERTAALSHTVDELKIALETLLSREKELQGKNLELQDLNTTLSIMLRRREQEHNDIRKDIAAETVETVLPLLKKAKTQLTGSARDYMETAQANLLDVFAKHPKDVVLVNARLAPRELQIVHYIRQDKTTKEIAVILGLSVRTVEAYRENIRVKLRIKNKKKNLKKFLTSML